MMTRQRTGSRSINCLRCKKPVEEVGCEVFHKDGSEKGVICSECAARPPRLRQGLMNKPVRGRLKGWSPKKKKKKKTSDWLDEFREVYGDGYRLGTNEA